MRHGSRHMLLALTRVFFVEPLLGLARFTLDEVATLVQLVGRVVRPEVLQVPSEESILANARQFFRFISYWVILLASAQELSGADADVGAEVAKYILLLGTYVFGFTVNYAIVSAARLWSPADFLTDVNSVVDLYNLIFFIAFAVNVVFGRIDVHAVGAGDVQLRVLLTAHFVIGAAFFVILRVRKRPLHGFTWCLIMLGDVLVHVFNMFMLNQMVYASR